MEHTSCVAGNAPSNKGGDIRSVRRFAAILAVAATLSQYGLAATPSLSVGSASGSAGSAVTLPLTFDPGTSSVAGIQFNLVLPSVLSTGTVTAGAIVTNAGKSISSNVNGGTWTFIIFGLNQTTIASGALLTAQVNIAAAAAPGSYNIPVTAVAYTDPNGTTIPAGTSTGGMVTVTGSIPVITSNLTITGVVGSVFTYQITATNSPTSFNATGLPAGLTINTVTGLISGTPTTAGTSSVTLSATNAGGTGNATLSLTINNPSVPVITSTGTATGQVGVAFSYQITATNSPTSFNATGLPAGLTVNTVTGLISGTPTTAGVTNVTISATNSGGAGTATLVLTINPAPNITLTKSANTSTAKSGDTLTFTIRYQNTTTGPANNVTITDVIPTGTTFVSGSITGGGTLSGNTITWILGTIAGGASGQVSFQVTVN